MGIIFFFVVTPIGILMRILKKDLLNLKFNKKTILIGLKKMVQKVK